jgi:acetyl-CoA carboxylase carboxyltransferase component
MSAMGITQIAAVMGACVAGGAYLPIMSDETLMVEGNGSIFLAGPYLVKAAIGEDTDTEKLGGAETHNALSGIADYKFDTEEECLAEVRKIVSRLGKPEDAGFDRVASMAPMKEPKEVYGMFPADPAKPYDMREIIERIVDGSDFDEFKASYGKSILCGYARIDGWAVGIVANQGRDADGWSDLQRQCRQGCAVHPQLQPETHTTHFPAGCHRLHGGHAQ